MNCIKTNLAGLYVFEPQVWDDERGYFMETFRSEWLVEMGFNNEFIQDNESQSCYGVLRGLHYQVYPHMQSKLVRVVEGEVLDVAVDIRPDSPTFGSHFSILLSAENKKQLMIPGGFAHGYAVISERAKFVYKCDAYYAKDQEGGIHFADDQLKIDWMLPKEDMIVSEKDQLLPEFGKHLNGPWG